MLIILSPFLIKTENAKNPAFEAHFVCLFIYFINIISKKQNKKLVSIKRLEKNKFQFKPFPAEVMMGLKCAIANASLSARPEAAGMEHKMEDVHAIS